MEGSGGGEEIVFLTMVTVRGGDWLWTRQMHGGHTQVCKLDIHPHMEAGGHTQAYASWTYTGINARRHTRHLQSGHTQAYASKTYTGICTPDLPCLELKAIAGSWMCFFMFPFQTVHLLLALELYARSKTTKRGTAQCTVQQLHWNTVTVTIAVHKDM